MVYLKILAVLAFIASVAWFISAPGWEPGILILTSAGAFIGFFIGENKGKKEKSNNQQQTVSKSSVGIQAGGDVNINNSKGDKKGNR